MRALIPPKENREPLNGPDVEAVESDILNLDSLFESMRGIRGIFHLAGVISILPGPNPFVRKVNVDGTKNVLCAAQESGVEYETISDTVKWFLERKKASSKR